MPYRSVLRPGLFAGQTIVVTGGGSGIGRCTAHELASLGAHVAIAGRKPDKLAAVKAEIEQSGGSCETHAFDIREETQVKDAIAAIVAKNGRIHGLFNNAGGPAQTGGHLREPVLMIASVMRALGASVNDANTLTALGANLGQTVFIPPSVFNYFAPGYQIPPQYTPGINLLGPEFQILSPSSAVGRINTVNAMVYGNLGNGAVLDLTPFAAVAGNAQTLVDAVSRAFFAGEMPDTMQTELLGAVNAITGTSAAVLRQRAQAAIYLAAASSYYNVEQ